MPCNSCFLLPEMKSASHNLFSHNFKWYFSIAKLRGGVGGIRINTHVIASLYSKMPNVVELDFSHFKLCQLVRNVSPKHLKWHARYCTFVERQNQKKVKSAFSLFNWRHHVQNVLLTGQH